MPTNDDLRTFLADRARRHLDVALAGALGQPCVASEQRIPSPDVVAYAVGELRASLEMFTEIVDRTQVSPPQPVERQLPARARTRRAPSEPIADVDIRKMVNGTAWDGGKGILWLAAPAKTLHQGAQVYFAVRAIQQSHGDNESFSIVDRAVGPFTSPTEAVNAAEREAKAEREAQGGR